MVAENEFYYIRTNRHTIDLYGYDRFKNYNLGILYDWKI